MESKDQNVLIDNKVVDVVTQAIEPIVSLSLSISICVWLSVSLTVRISHTNRDYIWLKNYKMCRYNWK